MHCSLDMDIERTGITGLIKNRNTQSNRITAYFVCFLIHLSNCKIRDEFCSITPTHLFNQSTSASSMTLLSEEILVSSS